MNVWVVQNMDNPKDFEVFTTIESAESFKKVCDPANMNLEIKEGELTIKEA